MRKGASRSGKGLVLALAGVALGCGVDANPTQPAAVAGDATITPVMAGATLDAPLPVAVQLAAARRATAAFHDVSAAYAAGYSTENEPCVEGSEGVMGVHAPNVSLIADQVLDPARPEALLYVPKPQGYRLVGVEYVQIVLLRDPMGTVAPWGSQDPWPAGYTVVTPTPRLFGQTFQGPMPGHTPTMPWHWDLHVWLWAPNPSGTFAEWNPALQCS